MFPASRIFAPFAPIPPGDNPHTLQAPSPGPDQWRLRLRTTADPASPSHPSPGPSWPGGAVAGLGPARRGPRPVAALSPGPDRWRLRLRAPTDPASPSPPSPGPSRPGGAVAGLGPARRGPRPVAAPSPGSYPGRQCPPPSYMSVLHRRPWAKLPPSCMSVRHRRPWAKSPLEFRTPPAENRAQCFHSQV